MINHSINRLKLQKKFQSNLGGTNTSHPLQCSLNSKHISIMDQSQLTSNILQNRMGRGTEYNKLQHRGIDLQQNKQASIEQQQPTNLRASQARDSACIPGYKHTKQGSKSLNVTRAKQEIEKQQQNAATIINTNFKLNHFLDSKPPEIERRVFLKLL